MLVLLILAAPAIVSPAAHASWECEFSEERNATIPAAGVRLLRLEAAAGALRVTGREGIAEIRVRGRACTSERATLSRIRLEQGREGDAARVAAILPSDGWGRNGYARLDLEIEVPARMLAEIRDGSGEATIEGIAGLQLTDGSGGVQIADIAGAVRVDDSSGDLRIRQVGGDLWISDSSGSISVDDVRGGVVVEEDSSGDIEIRRVQRDVQVGRDSSGDIDVARVGGSFTVSRDGSGAVRANDVAGAVRLPPSRRRS